MRQKHARQSENERRREKKDRRHNQRREKHVSRQQIAAISLVKKKRPLRVVNEGANGRRKTETTSVISARDRAPVIDMIHKAFAGE